MAEAQGQAAMPAASNTEAFVAALMDQESAPVPEKEPKAAAQPEPDAEPPQPVVEGEDAPKEEPEEQEARGETAEIPLETLMEIPLEVTVNGESKKVTVKDLRAGYMMQEDYSRKTADVARQREQIGQERQGFNNERQQYQKNLDQLQSLVMATAAQELNGVNWNELAANNPAEYVRLTNRRDQISQVLQNINAQQTEATTKAEAAKRQAYQETSLATVAKLKADVPNWNDELYEKILQNAVANGVPRKVANEWNETGQIKLAHKAMLYDQLQAGKPVAEKKVINVPKVIKPGAVTGDSAKVKTGQAALKRLKSTGKQADLADYLATQM